jgi:hypothetical protein
VIVALISISTWVERTSSDLIPARVGHRGEVLLSKADWGSKG